MMELFKVAAKLVLDKTGYDQDVSEADKSGKSLAENLSGYMEKAKKVLTGIVSAVAIKKVASSLWDLAKETAAAGDRIDKTSQALGMSRKAFQEWDYILSQSGASIDSMGMTMKTMQEAINGNSAETAAALSKLGLSAAKLQNLTPEQQFEELVKAFQKMPDSAKKSQLALQLFGRNAQSLMPLLNSASGTVDELRKRANELGLVMSDEDVDASVAFGDALDDLNRTWSSLKMKFGAQMLPTLTKGLQAAANALGKVSNAVADAFKTGDWSKVFDVITNEVKTLLPKFINTVVNIGVGLFQNADKIISLAFSLINGLIQGIRENIPMFVQKLPDIFKSVVEGLKNIATTAGNAFIDIINSIFGTNIPHIDEIKWPTWDEVKAAAETAWKAIKTGLETLVTTIGKFVFGERDDGSVDWPTWDDVGAFAKTAWEGIKTGLSGLATSVGKFIFGERDDGSVAWPTWEEVGAFAKTAWEGIQSGLTTLATSIGKFIFGERDDGSVAWPTWDEVGAMATEAWEGIKSGLSTLATTVGKFIFGERDDGSVNWPTWDDVVSKATEAWQGIKTGLEGLVTQIGKFIFGERDDGSVKWPTWAEVGQAARDAVSGIITGLGNLLTELGKFIFGERDDSAATEWISWDDVKAAAETAWKGIVEGLKGLGTMLGAFVFGTRDDGSVDWPTWADVETAATQAWQGIKDGLSNLATSIGSFIFGARDDGSVKWPTWEDVETAAIQAWQGIKDGLAGLGTSIGAFIFGERDDGSVKWPTWADVETAATQAWQGIKDGLASLGTSIGAFVFGTRDDGAVKWPEWSDLESAFTTWWQGADGNGGIKGEIAKAAKWVIGALVPPEAAKVVEDIKTWWNGSGEDGDGGVLGKIVEGLKNIVFGIGFPDVIQKIVSWWNGSGDEGDDGVLGKAIQGMSDLVFKFTTPKVNEIKNQIVSWWNDVTRGLVLGIQGIWQGIVGKPSEDSPTPTMNNSGIPVVDMTGKPGGGGRGSASGLNYVPYDDYHVRLHRGEAVLNRSQSESWRQNGSGFNTQQLYSAVASAVAEAVSNIQINMDGKAVANAVTGQVSRNMYQAQLGRRYMPV